MPENTDWDNEYHFWHKIISEEVERLRFNQGLEPIAFELYETLGKKDKTTPDFYGTTQIGRRIFRVVGNYRFNSEGARVIKIEIFPKDLSEAEQARLWAQSSKRLYNDDKK